jgi:hypothetical protein
MEEFSKICNQESEESTIVYRESLDDFLGGIYFEKNTHQLYFVENIIQYLGERINRKTLTSFLAAFVFSIGTPAFAKSKEQFQPNSQTKDRGQLSSSDFEKPQRKSKYNTPQKNQSTNDRLKNFPPKMDDDVVDTFRLHMESKHPQWEKALIILKLKDLSPIHNRIAIMAQDHTILQNKHEPQTASRREKEKWTGMATVVVKWIRKYKLLIITLVVGAVMFVFYQKFRNFKLFNLFNNPKDTTPTLFPNGNVDVIQLIPEVEREVQILAEEQVLPEIQSLSEQLEQLREIVKIDIIPATTVIEAPIEIIPTNDSEIIPSQGIQDNGLIQISNENNVLSQMPIQRMEDNIVNEVSAEIPTVLIQDMENSIVNEILSEIQTVSILSVEESIVNEILSEIPIQVPDETNKLLETGIEMNNVETDESSIGNLSENELIEIILAEEQDHAKKLARIKSCIVKGNELKLYDAVLNERYDKFEKIKNDFILNGESKASNHEEWKIMAQLIRNEFHSQMDERILWESDKEKFEKECL